MKTMIRIIVGALVAPLVVPLLYLAGGLCCSGYAYVPGHMGKFLDGVNWFAMASYITTYSLGIPIIVILYVAGRLRIMPLLLWAGICGAAATFVFLWCNDSSHGLNLSYVILPGVGGLLALVVALTFWFVSGVKRQIRTS